MREDIKKIINGEEKQILIRTTNFRKPYIILSGSFNPFHIGHNNLLTAAEKLSGRNGILELSIYNVDKLNSLFKNLDTICRICQEKCPYSEDLRKDILAMNINYGGRING